MGQISEKTSELRRQIKQQTAGYLTAALGLVAGLAWNDAIKELITYLFPLEQNSLAVRFIYAIIITIVVVLLSVYLAKVFQPEDKEQ